MVLPGGAAEYHVWSIFRPRPRGGQEQQTPLEGLRVCYSAGKEMPETERQLFCCGIEILGGLIELFFYCPVNGYPKNVILTHVFLPNMNRRHIYHDTTLRPSIYFHPKCGAFAYFRAWWRGRTGPALPQTGAAISRGSGRLPLPKRGRGEVCCRDQFSNNSLSIRLSRAKS